MDVGGPAIALAVIAVAAAWVIVSLIKAFIRKPVSGARDEVERLEAENFALREKLGTVEARLAVLERIATDPAERTAREIEKLR